MSIELNMVTEHALNKFFENTGRALRETEIFISLKEKYCDKAEKYESLLSESDKDLCEDYIAVLNELHAAEIDFLYKQGYIDCVHILKKLTII